jgi:hypothetical protein
MNTLIVGSDKEPLLHHLPDKFLFIDDGPLIDTLDMPTRRAVTVFDPTKHSFNPLKDMSYLKARDFLDVLNAAFPEGDSTLTKRNSNFILLQALLSKPRSLATLLKPTKDNTDAYQKLQTLLLSPVLESVLTKPTNMSFKGSIIARLDRAVLGDFVCFVLANLLISHYSGTVVIPDFGFYACPSHVSLIRQNRLVAGINSFDEVPKLRNELVLIEKKVASRSTPEDAALLALYAGIPAHTIGYNDFIQSCITGNR